MHVRYEYAEGCLRVSLAGELGHHEAISLMGRLAALVDDHLPARTVLDLSELEFMDSSGIGVIMGRYRQVIFQGGRVGVMGVGANVNRIFKVSGLYKIVEQYKSAEEAFIRPAKECFADSH